MSMAGQSERVAEVVEAASAAFIAQCYALDGAPPLGALVRTGDPPTYGVVCNIESGPLDAGRRVTARGHGEDSEEALYRSNPQLERLLVTRLEARIVGYDREGATRQGLPSLPPRLHAFVYVCTPEEVRAFTRSFDFIHLLAAVSPPTGDEVVTACLRRAASVQPDPEAFLVAAGQALAGEMADDMGRLSVVLRGLRP